MLRVFQVGRLKVEELWKIGSGMRKWADGVCS